MKLKIKIFRLLIIVSFYFFSQSIYSMNQERTAIKVCSSQFKLTSTGQIKLESIQRLYQTESLKEITLSWIVNNISVSDLLTKIDILTQDAKELILKKIIDKYKFELISLFHFILVGQDTSSIQFSWCGKFALTIGSKDNACIFWNLRDWNNINSILLYDVPMSSVSFSPCGKFIYAKSKDQTFHALFDLMFFDNITLIPLKKPISEINSESFNQTNKLFGLGESIYCTVKYWNLKGLQFCFTFEQLLFLAFLLENKVNGIDFTNVFKDKKYLLIFNKFINKEQIFNHFKK